MRTSLWTVAVVVLSISHGYPMSKWNKADKLDNGQSGTSSHRWRTQEAPEGGVSQSYVDNSDQICSLTLKIPKVDLQASCSQKSPDVSEQLKSLRSYCDRKVNEVETRLRMYLLHEASVRLELEQRLLHVENTTKNADSKPNHSSADSTDKKLLQHMLNRLHLEKLARDDLENKVNRLQQKLEDSAIDCEFIRRPGEYRIQPLSSDIPVQVYCDRGWTLIQRRINGSVDFYRGWQSYCEGFGDINGEFWLGNDNIHRITTQGEYRLRIDMEDWYGNQYHAEYSHFWIDSRLAKYKLHVSGHHGNIEDALAHEDPRHKHSGMPFSTPDQNNQLNKTSYCAEIYHGAWWYNSCYSANLNGRYCNHGTHDGHVEGDLSQCMIWWGGGDTERVIMKTVIMKVKELSDKILYLKSN